MKYEYLIISEDFLTLADIKYKLNELGKEGWLLIQIDGTIMYFVREIKE